MNIIELAETQSTNTYLSAIATVSAHGTVVVAHAQTAGRGQRGNHWESAPGENITMSLLLRPRSVRPAEQFIISQAVSVAIVKVLRRYIKDHAVTVKWPNDIYVDDMKICGILIENSLSGSSIEYSIVGMGINVNQTLFLSDAPNPVSLSQLTGRQYPLHQLAEEFVNEILIEFDKIDSVSCDLQPNTGAMKSGKSMSETHHENSHKESSDIKCGVSSRQILAKEYFSMLWRSNGYYPYHDNIRNCDFLASIKSIAPTGHITLLTTQGDQYTYAFKEITSVSKQE